MSERRKTIIRCMGVGFIGIAAAMASAFLISTIHNSSKVEAQRNQTEQVAHATNQHILNRITGVAQELAKTPEIVRVATGESGIDNPAAVLVLETTRINFSASIAYVMNKEGLLWPAQHTMAATA
ncbi:MAG: hypothetical protein JXR97_12980 [Planctomycetes bacterium]|nr:hypothetical protein [Planctomycetota bacterium]